MLYLSWKHVYILRGENKRLKKYLTDEQKLAATKADLIQQVQAGLITAQRAQELYSNQLRLLKSVRNNRKTKNIMVLIGSILIGLGIILLGFYNWDSLTPTIKLFVAVSWLVIVQIIFYFTIIKKVFFKNHAEAVSALYALTVGGSIILTGNTFPLTYDIANSLLIWMVLILPAIYLAQSLTIATIYSIVMIYWAGHAWNESFILIIWLLLAMIIPFTYKMLAEKRVGVHLFSSILATSTVIAFIVSMLDYWQGCSLQISMVFIAMITLFANRLKVKNYILERIGFLSILVINLFLTFSAAWSGFLGIDVARTMPGTPLFVVYLLITAIMMILVNKIHLLGRLSFELTIIALTPFFVGVATIVAFYKLDTLYSMVIISAYIFCLALAIAYDGLKNNSSATLNKGLLVFTLLVIVRFFDSQMSFQSRAIAFIAVGILFLASNWFLRYRANRKDNEIIADDLFDTVPVVAIAKNTSNDLVIDLDEAVQQVQLLQNEKIQQSTPEPPISNIPPATAENTITVGDLSLISLQKKAPKLPIDSQQDDPANVASNNSLKNLPDSPKQNHNSSVINIEDTVRQVKIFPQEKLQIPLPVPKTTSTLASPPDSTITVKNLNIISPSGNVKIIADNTPKIIDTQRFKNASEIKKN